MMSEKEWQNTSAGASSTYVKHDKPPNQALKKMEVQFTFIYIPTLINQNLGNYYVLIALLSSLKMKMKLSTHSLDY